MEEECGASLSELVPLSASLLLNKNRKSPSNISCAWNMVHIYASRIVL